MAKITKTMGPMHFEDLDPHRFEDLIRELIYDWKDWQNIEATGRGGSDDGFDIRAWEKTKEITNKDEEDENNVGVHPMDGKLWMIQGKREKELGPSAVEKIIKDTVSEKSPPYGYVLVAPVNFTKKSYDVFREELRKKGVMEFHLWGRAELEDMLHQPKNDHILFTFFGISLVAKKRSRRTDLRFAINNKNKLLRVLGEGNNNAEMFASVLLRDFQDERYPYEGEYKDFEKKPRWGEHIVRRFHPHGIIIDVSKWYAYIDIEKKEFDFTKVADQIHRKSEIKDYKIDEKIAKNRMLVEDFWKHLPRKNQAMLLIEGIVLFEDMLVIDDKGDTVFDMPHIFVDFQYKGKPFRGKLYYLEGNKTGIELRGQKEWKRVKIFPKVFAEVKEGKVHEDKTVTLDEETWRLFRIDTGVIENDIFDVDGKYSFLHSRDMIAISGVDTTNEANFLRITHKYTTTVKEYMKDKKHYERANIERQVGRNVKDGEKINVYEFKRTYHFASRQ